MTDIKLKRKIINNTKYLGVDGRLVTAGGALKKIKIYLLIVSRHWIFSFYILCSNLYHAITE